MGHLSRLSLYPPGHPTGTDFGATCKVFICENHQGHRSGLSILLTSRDVRWRGGQPCCPNCHAVVARAGCEVCGKPSTHIDTDQAVNVSEAYCGQHRMGFWQGVA